MDQKNINSPRKNGSGKFKKIAAYKVDYDFYFKNNQGIFVLQSHMKYVDLAKIKKKHNLKQYLQQIPRFESMK